MRIDLWTAGLAAALALGLSGPVLAADDAPAGDAAKAADKKDKDKDEIQLPPFPADASVKQSVKTNHGDLNYTATVGSLPVRDEKGKKIAEVVFNAYILDGPRQPNRPVTFAFNGGPGAASVYLNLGAIGPKHVPFGAQGDAPSTPAQLVDNPETWLDFTDLVFIDPVGTGFSRSLTTDEVTKKKFYSVKPDIEYLSRIVYDWLNKNGRLASPKYIAGESYGGFRGPRIAHYLQTRQGVGVSGVVLVSPYLDGNFDNDDATSPMPWVIRLPSMAAAKLEREGKLTPQTLQAAEDYARGDFVTDYMKGVRDEAATGRITSRMVELTGVDPALAHAMGGRVDTQTLLREVYRRQGKVGSRYDINVTAFDPFPFSYAAKTGGGEDPILDSIIAPTTSAMVDFDTRVVGWKVDAPYFALSYDVGEKWESGSEVLESVTDLRQAMAIDPHMKVLIVHGYTDLSCPFFASKLIVDQIPTMGDPGRVSLKLYPGGHMFYSRPDSRAMLHKDAQAIYGG